MFEYSGPYATQVARRLLLGRKNGVTIVSMIGCWCPLKTRRSAEAYFKFRGHLDKPKEWRRARGGYVYGPGDNRRDV